MGGLVEVDAAVHHAVIGDGNGRHLLLDDGIHQLFDRAGAVQEAERRVQVQVYEWLL